MLLCCICISICVWHGMTFSISSTPPHIACCSWWSMHILSSSVYNTLEISQICTRVCASHMESCSGSNEISLDALAAQATPSGARCASPIRCSHRLYNCTHQVLSIALIPAHICTCVVQQLHTPMRFCCDSTCIRLQKFAHILQYNHRGGFSKQFQPRSFL